MKIFTKERCHVGLLLFVEFGQACWDTSRLAWGELDWSGGGMVTLKIIPNERLTGNNSVFCLILHKISNYVLKLNLIQSDCRIFLSSIYLEQISHVIDFLHRNDY